MLRAIALLVFVEVGAVAQAPAQLSLQKDIRIGSADDVEWSLASPEPLTVGPNGHIFIADQRSGSIKEFDADGRYVGTIGRKGRGPGEIQGIRRMGFLGDTLWTTDPQLQRVTLYAPGRRSPITLSLIYNVGPDNQSGTGRGGRGGQAFPSLNDATPSGMLLGGAAAAQADYAIGWSRGTSVPTPVPIVLLDRAGSVTATLATPTFTSHRGISIAGTNKGRPATYVFEQLFEVRPSWTTAPDGSGVIVVDAPMPATAAGATFTIRRFDASGQKANERAYGYDPMAITPRLRDSVVRGLARRGGVTDPAGAERAIRDSLFVPRFVPTVSGIVGGRDGSLWLRRELLGEMDFPWDLVDPAGRIVGRVVVPGRNILYGDMNYVYVKAMDADGVLYVDRYRVVQKR